MLALDLDRVIRMSNLHSAGGRLSNANLVGEKNSISKIHEVTFITKPRGIT